MYQLGSKLKLHRYFEGKLQLFNEYLYQININKRIDITSNTPTLKFYVSEFWNTEMYREITRPTNASRLCRCKPQKIRTHRNSIDFPVWRDQFQGLHTRVEQYKSTIRKCRDSNQNIVNHLILEASASQSVRGSQPVS